MNTQFTVEPRAGTETVRDRVVVGFDGSPSSVAAVDWAAEEAAARGSALRVVTCSAVPASVDFYAVGTRQAQSLSDVVSTVRGRHPDLVVEQATTHLDPRDALIDEAADADLLVVGSSESGMAKAWLLGSVPRTAARRSPCPVIVVRGEWQQPPRRIVIGVDSSSAAAAAVEWASAEANRHGAEILVVHAWQRPGDAGQSVRARDLARADAQCILDLAVNRCRERSGGLVRGELVQGSAAAALIEASVDADLLAVGSRGRSGFRTMLFGSVALSVSEHAACPVAVSHPCIPNRERQENGR